MTAPVTASATRRARRAWRTGYPTVRERRRARMTERLAAAVTTGEQLTAYYDWVRLEASAMAPEERAAFETRAAHALRDVLAGAVRRT